MKEATKRRSARASKQNIENTAPPAAGRARCRSATKNSNPPENIQSVPIAENQRKRKRSVSNSAERPKITKKIVDGRVIDSHCWVCHKFSGETGCSSCPRVYHKDCLRKLKGGSAGVPPSCECQLKTVDRKIENLELDPRQLKKLLQYVMQEAIKEDKKSRPRSTENNKFCTYFQAWPAENDNLCKVMDLNILIDNMNGEEPYFSTGQFFMDVKWIYHNCCILYRSDCEISETALKLEKNFKLELTDMEACPECYQIKYSDDYLHADFFTKVCSKPHPIIWAKLRGFSYWPAKCLMIHNGHADVRFFGTHDKASILVKQCFKISRHPPGNKDFRQQKFKDATAELSIYISNYKNIHGAFPWYPDNTPLENSGENTKKSNRKGRRKNVDRASRNETSTENLESNLLEPLAADSGLKEKFSEPKVNKSNILDAQVDSKSKALQLLAKLGNAENTQNIAESGVDLNSDVLCHMTFTADEHNGPASELNASEEIVADSLASSLTFPSSSQTPDLLSTDPGLPSCSNFVNTTDAETSTMDFINMNSVPIITSAVSANGITLDQLSGIASSVPNSGMSLNSMINSLSSTFPIITSTSSTCEAAEQAPRVVSASTEEQVKEMMDNLQSGSSCGEVPDLNGISAEQLLVNDDPDNDEEVTVLSEKKQGIVQKFFQTPSLVKAVLEIILGNYPQMKEILNYLNAVTVQAILSMWVSFNSSKLQSEGGKDILKFCAQNVRRCRTLQRHLNAALQAKAEAEHAKADLEKQVKELSERIETLTKLSSHKTVLKDSIIMKVSEKIRNKQKNAEDCCKDKFKEMDKQIQRHKTSEEHLRQENETLAAELKEAKCKIEFMEQENLKLAKELKESRQKMNSGINCETQTDGMLYLSPEREILNQSQSLPQLINRQSGVIMVETNVSSVPGNSSLGGGVIQHVFEQNVLMSERTMITTPSAGVITSAPSSLLPLNVVVPSCSVMPPQGPIILDSESSKAYLESLHPPKPQPRISGLRKTYGHRKKHNS